MQARTNATRWPRPAIGRLGLSHALMLFAGLATFVLVSSVLRDRSATAEVWMIRDDVAAGSTLTGGDLTAVAVSADDPLLPALQEVSAGIPTSTVRHDLTSGEPLLASDLVADQLSVGRTFTIPIESIVLDGLGLSRGDRLDVIGADFGGTMQYVVTDVEVARLPGTATSTAFAAASSRNAWVTVVIDQGEALELSQALDRGEVVLVRSTGAAAIDGQRIADAEVES